MLASPSSLSLLNLRNHGLQKTTTFSKHDDIFKEINSLQNITNTLEHHIQETMQTQNTKFILPISKFLHHPKLEKPHALL